MRGRVAAYTSVVSFRVCAGTTIGPSLLEWKEKGKFLKWKELSIMRVGKGTYEVQVT